MTDVFIVDSFLAATSRAEELGMTVSDELLTPGRETNMHLHARYGLMTYKTLTISEEAYNALARVKGKDESFTKAIPRLTRKKADGNLLDYIRSLSPDEELASAVEKVLEKRGKTRLRAPEF